MVINVLKNGEIIPDLTGHEVSREQVPEFFAIAERLNGGREKDEE